MATCDYEVVVIGAGVIGSATAYYLSRKLGNKALLLEQYDFLHRRGSSHGDSRITRYSYPQDYYTELMLDAFKLWDEAEKESSLQVFTRTGGLDIGRNDNPSLLNVIANNKKFGIQHEVFSDPVTLMKRFPMVKLKPKHIAVFAPSSGILNATKAVSMFQQLAKANGCHLRDNSSVSKISQDAKTRIITITLQNGDKITTRKCITASGAWTNKVLSKAGAAQLPLNPIQTTIAYWKVQKPYEYSYKKFPVFINHEDPHVYGTPAHEFPNLIKCAAHYGPDCDPDNRSFDTGNELREVSSWLQSNFTGVSPTPQITESCMYTLSPDHDYILDKIPGYDGMFVGCGFSGHGFKLAPVVGKLLADWAVTGKFPYAERIQNVFAVKRFNSLKSRL